MDANQGDAGRGNTENKSDNDRHDIAQLLAATFLSPVHVQDIQIGDLIRCTINLRGQDQISYRHILSVEKGVKCYSYTLYENPFSVLKNPGGIPDNAEKRGWKLERVEDSLANNIIRYYKMLSSG